MSQTIRVSKAIYPEACLQETIVAYRNLCTVSFTDVSNDEYVIEIRQCSADVDEKLLSHEFLNYLLDVCLEQRLRPKAIIA
jgi:hypothetical protein